MSQQQHNGWVQKPNGQWVPAPRAGGPNPVQKGLFVIYSLTQIGALLVLLFFIGLVLWAIFTT